MFRIRKIFDDVSPANRDAVAQVVTILRAQFPRTRAPDIEKLPAQLQDPLKFRYRTILLVAEESMGRVKGFAVLLYMPDVRIAYLELMSAAPGRTGGGIGSALYERVREEAVAMNVEGLFFECSVDDPKWVRDPTMLKQNIARLRFYERYGARPLDNNNYATPVHQGDEDLYFLVYDGLGREVPLSRARIRRAVRAILERKYGELLSAEQINAVCNSFRDDPVTLRPPRYSRKEAPLLAPPSRSIALVVNEGHAIHHVRDRGYVQAPVRLSVILREINKTGLFVRQSPRRVSEKYVKQVHDADFVDYLRRACEQMPPGKSIYPIIFPIRNVLRPPKDVELQVGYYCMDTFTPLNHNAYLAARGAVDCAVTGAELLLEGFPLAYALVRPPGHHAERRAFGGFCYFNSAAVAAHYLSQYGRVAILDVDFHHGNGTQDIFYERADVFTVSIHGDPHTAYPHFSGFADEQGQGPGAGFNLNLPLPDGITPERYRRALRKALVRIADFAPQHLVVCLGLDTAKADPTGTWSLAADDFRENGRLIGALGLPTLVVQEGGYRTRTLGTNARHFFEGLWDGYRRRPAAMGTRPRPVP